MTFQFNEIRPGRSGRVNRRGAALIEFAIVFSLLVLIVFGCVDFGRFALTSIAVTSAAREGASVGSVNPTTPATLQAWRARITQAITEDMQGHTGFDVDKLVVDEPQLIQNGDAQRVQVTVTYPFRPVFLWRHEDLMGSANPTTFHIKRTAEMRVIR